MYIYQTWDGNMEWETFGRDSAGSETLAERRETLRSCLGGVLTCTAPGTCVARFAKTLAEHRVDEDLTSSFPSAGVKHFVGRQTRHRAVRVGSL